MQFYNRYETVLKPFEINNSITHELSHNPILQFGYQITRPDVDEEKYVCLNIIVYTDIFNKNGVKFAHIETNTNYDVYTIAPTNSLIKFEIIDLTKKFQAVLKDTKLSEIDFDLLDLDEDQDLISKSIYQKLKEAVA
jgi:hypothetical protein